MRPKIATCCYCGTRAALVLRDGGRHELSCAACGAPLQALKSIPMDEDRPASRPRGNRPTQPAPVRRQAARCAPGPARPEKSASRPDKKKRRPRKRRKPLAARIFEEVWDVVEDIFD